MENGQNIRYFLKKILSGYARRCNARSGKLFLLLSFLQLIFIHPDLVAQGNWMVSFKGIGTFSSPRVTDLNGDGTGDVVFGAGREEFKACDSAVIALDGLTGKMLWHVHADDHIFGSPSFRDINGDRIMDVIIGGYIAGTPAPQLPVEISSASHNVKL